MLNTISDEHERIDVIKTLLSLLKTNGNIFIAVRSIEELKSSKSKALTPYKDGVVTAKGTFQKYFSKEDLNSLLHNNFNNINITYLKFNNKTLLIKLSKEGVDSNKD